MVNSIEYWQMSQAMIGNTQDTYVQNTLGEAERQTRAEEFQRLLETFDAEQQRLNEAAKKEREAEAKLKKEKKEREKRINEIRALMMHYRHKLSINQQDTAAQAALSELETKLFWLMFSL